MMINDRELLELAARAASIKYKWEQEGYAYGDVGIVPKGWRRCWNQLTDDGDALRLAVKLNISINFGIFATKINCEIYDWEEDEVLVEWKEDGRKDPYAATRRAIVRAAAEIGKRISIV